MSEIEGKAFARLKADLVYAGIKQKDVAVDLDVHPSLVSAVLAGRIKSERVLSHIRQVLNRKAA